MADFFAHGFDKKVDSLMDLLFGAGVNSHATIIEQINYLLFLRSLSKRDEELIELGIEDKDQIVFDGDLSEYRWENLLMLNPDALFTSLEKCYTKVSESTSSKTVRLLYRDAHLKIYDKPTLRRLVHEIDKFAKDLETLSEKGQKDIFGDMYEYLLSKLNQSGTAGQFRTPRHIIEFIVNVLDPQKGETILDPACGTAGFLVKAYESLAKKYTSEKYLKEGSYSFDKLNTDEKQFLYNHTFTGFDSDSDMIKFGMMNLFLHGLENARLIRQNTLTDTAGNREKWDVILANPPFAGKIDRESVAEDLQMGTGATEILFLRYMLDHLSQNGRVGVIVPEGVIFSNSTAHKKIRQMLLEKGLWCVVSLPAGVFNPYAGVKTSILFVDKTTAAKVKEVLFVTIENDGFDLGASKRPIDKNDLPESFKTINEYKDFLITNKTHNNIFLERIQSDKKVGETVLLRHDKLLLVSKDEIVKKEYNLSAGSYRFEEIFSDKKWPMMELGEICEILNGYTFKSEKYTSAGIRVIRITNVQKGEIVDADPKFYATDSSKEIEKFLLEKNDLLISLTGNVGRVGLLQSGLLPAGLNQRVGCIRLIDNKTMSINYLFHILNTYLFEDACIRASSGVAQKNLSTEWLKKYQIPLPPLEIQEKIVTELNGYQSIIAGAKQIVANWKPKIDIDPKWENKAVSEIAKLEYGVGEAAKDSGEYRYVRITDIGENGELKDTDKKYINETKESKKYLLKKGDVLVARTGATFGKTMYFDEDEKSAFAGFLIRFNFEEDKILSKYFWCFAQSDSYWEQAKSLMTGGGQPQFNASAVGKIVLPLPPLAIQKQIVEKIEAERTLVESSKKLIEIYDQKTREKISEVWGD